MHDVNICRRVSGGGTVYHDLGNLNLTFSTHRTNYNRKENLQFITRTLSSVFTDLQLECTDKDDILLNGEYKVSGSAAKLGLTSAFHHCTLLCDSDLASVRGLLSPDYKVQTNATASRPSPVANILEGRYNFHEVCELFNKCYKETYNPGSAHTSIHAIHPLQHEGVGERAEKFKSWQWVYGKSPLFTLLTSVRFDDGECCDVSLRVCKGKVEKAKVVSDVKSELNADLLNALLQALVGEMFSHDCLDYLPSNTTFSTKVLP